MSRLPEIAHAATLILLRDMPGRPPEILMVERGKQLAFAGGNMVFPGGRIDDDDRIVAARADLIAAGPALDADDIALRVTAVRETWEETGLAPSVIGLTSVDQLEQVRTEMAAGKRFSDALAEHRLRIDPHQLTMFAHWIPELEAVRRFDTRFYVAAAPDLGEAQADGSESRSVRWASAADHLAAGNVIFPTLRNLERIGLADSHADAVALCARYPVRPVSPWLEDRDGVEYLCIPDDLGYPVTAVLAAGIMRGIKAAIARAPG